MSTWKTAIRNLHDKCDEIAAARIRQIRHDCMDDPDELEAQLERTLQDLLTDLGLTETVQAWTLASLVLQKESRS